MIVHSGLDATLHIDDTIDIEVTNCNEGGPFDKTADEVVTLGRVNRVSIEKCHWGEAID